MRKKGRNGWNGYEEGEKGETVKEDEGGRREIKMEENKGSKEGMDD